MDLSNKVRAEASLDKEGHHLKVLLKNTDKGAIQSNYQMDPKTINSISIEQQGNDVCINAALTQATNSKTRDYATAHPIPRDVNKSELKAVLNRAKVPEEEMAKFFSPKQSTEQKASAKEVAKEMKETVTKTESIEVPLRNDKKEIISEKLSGSTSLSDKKKMDAINKAKNPKKPNN